MTVIGGGRGPSGAFDLGSACAKLDTASSVACVPPSGSTFPVGTNTVQCTVSDFANHSASCTFTAQVNGPAEQAADLVTKINGLQNVPAATNSSFIAVKLQAALAALARGNTMAACGDLKLLANEVQAQAGKKLTAAQAVDLLADITRIRAALGC